ncbi:MAG: class I SAM-dependent methyltransferase [Anaerolineaceae bacterium]|nr:class I SAM-dependent methyltransferase [Anaerolineaceae bacterium]
MNKPSNNLWDERYSQHAYAYGTQPNEFLSNQISQLPTGQALSIGEGQGRNAVYLAKQGYAVTAVDASSVGIQQAGMFASQEQVEINFINADLAAYKIESSKWNLILSIYCHLPSEVRKSVHQQVVNGLAPGGMFLLEAFSPQQIHNQTGGPKNPDMLASLDQLQSELDGVTFIIAQQIEREVEEGLHHSGMASVVQILAQKSE